jgi:hypothetical protein
MILCKVPGPRVSGGSSLLKGGALAGVQRPGGCQDRIKLGVA